MSKVTASADFDRVKAEDLAKFLAIFGDDVASVLNNGLDFETNFNCKIVGMTFGAANTDTTAAHGLGRVPIGYLVYSRTASMVVFNGAGAWSSSTITLQASAAGTVSMIVF